MSTPCGVKWCCAMAAADSEFCAVHKAHPDYNPAQGPDLLYPDACPDCGGSGECFGCGGDGESLCECEACGNGHHADCDECDGTGDCNGCDGVGKAK